MIILAVFLLGVLLGAIGLYAFVAWSILKHL